MRKARRSATTCGATGQIVRAHPLSLELVLPADPSQKGRSRVTAKTPPQIALAACGPRGAHAPHLTLVSAPAAPRPHPWTSWLLRKCVRRRLSTWWLRGGGVECAVVSMSLSLHQLGGAALAWRDLDWSFGWDRWPAFLSYIQLRSSTISSAGWHGIIGAIYSHGAMAASFGAGSSDAVAAMAPRTARPVR